MILDSDYFVRYAALPMTVEGVTLPNDDGTFNIYINSDLPESRQQEKLWHELRHICKDHFYCESQICEIEADANRARNKSTPFADMLKNSENLGATFDIIAEAYLYGHRIT